MFLGGVSSYDGNDGNDGHGRSLSVDEDIVSAHNTFNTVVTVLSLAGSSLVLLTALMFPSIIRNKTLSFTIMMVSFNNWLTSISNTFGFPKGDACVVQGIITLIGIKGSWLCVTLVCHQLRKIITTGKLALNSRQTVYVYIGYQICQILYTKALGYDFGNPKSSQGEGTCVYYDPKKGEGIFEEGVLGLLLFEYLMMIFVIYDIVLITRHVSDLKIKASTEYDKVNALKKSAWLYPLFMLVVWTPLTSIIIYISVQSSNNAASSPGLFAFAVIATSWSYLDGFFNAVVYFSNGKGVRHLWFTWLSKYAIGRLYLSAFAWIQWICLECMNSLMRAIGRADIDGGSSGSGNPLHAQSDQEDKDKDTENENANNEEDFMEDFLNDEAMESAMAQMQDNQNAATTLDVELSTSVSMSAASASASASASPLESFRQSKVGSNKYAV